MINATRGRLLNHKKERDGPILYWMSRDQRVDDNWALIYAQEMAIKRGVPLAVIFCVVPTFLGATVRQYGFMLKGLREVEKHLGKKNITFHLVKGLPERTVVRFVKKHGIGALYTDFDPLRIKRLWKEKVAEAIAVPCYEVDAHNIVPCWLASPKREYGAATFRPKVNRLLPVFLDAFPAVQHHPFTWQYAAPENHWDDIMQSLAIDRSVPEVAWMTPGERAAKKELTRFISKKLAHYGALRNDPTRDGQSHLSPYLHFGQLSAQRVALEVKSAHCAEPAKRAFMEELIVRRELSDNFCYYTANYDSFAAFPQWAQETLDNHRKDRRDYLYSLDEFEKGKTHDELWNAAQREMVTRGKMHGYMRMYWAKKILEWTTSPEEALGIAVYLNDRYELDGRDPNGYTGIAWSLGGVHDRAWRERKVFGKVRYMSYNGCKSKFNVAAYIEKTENL